MEEKKHMLVHVKQSVEKSIIESLAEQTRKHDEELNMPKQLQAAMNNQLQDSRTLQEQD
jgi:hypothetical protein